MDPLKDHSSLPVVWEPQRVQRGIHLSTADGVTAAEQRGKLKKTVQGCHQDRGLKKGGGGDL